MLNVTFLLFIAVVLAACQNTDNGRQKDSFRLDHAPIQIDRTIWQKPSFVIELLGDLTDKTVVDLGAGSGYFTFRLMHRAAKVIAVDIDKDMLDLIDEERSLYGEELSNKVETRLVNPNDPGLADGEADVVFISNTYAYLNNRIDYLKRLRPKMKRGAKLLILDLRSEGAEFDSENIVRISANHVVAELQAAGFEIELTDKTSLEYQYIILAQLKAAVD